MQVHTQESDWEDDTTQEEIIPGHPEIPNGSDAPGTPDLEDGMLPRDVPKRTTFHDPVAERQMSQTDAKLFYQRSKIDVRSGVSGWSQSSPVGSPVMAAGSRATTEYGADSLILEHDEGEH